MTILGAIIAGGRSMRFGSDKAAALLNGKALIDHVAGGLRPQCDALIICGRAWPGYRHIADHPAPDLGPLGGLCAALVYARRHGFDAVVTAGCDTLPVASIPPDSPCFIAGHYLFGRWPVGLSARLEAHLTGQSDHSMRGWITASGARQVEPNTLLWNLNTPAELRSYQMSLVHAA